MVRDSLDLYDNFLRFVCSFIILALMISYWHDKKHKRAIIRLVHGVCMVTIILTLINLILMAVDQSGRGEKILEEWLAF